MLIMISCKKIRSQNFLFEKEKRIGRALNPGRVIKARNPGRVIKTRSQKFYI